MSGLFQDFRHALRILATMYRDLRDRSDVGTFSAVGGVLLAVSLASSWLPARRACRVAPAKALRTE
jgi:ABC-type lipoprotein release transport system permease subunit